MSAPSMTYQDVVRICNLPSALEKIRELRTYLPHLTLREGIDFFNRSKGQVLADLQKLVSGTVACSHCGGTGRVEQEKPE